MIDLATHNAAVMDRVRAGNEKARMYAADRAFTEELRAAASSKCSLDRAIALGRAQALSVGYMCGCPMFKGASDA